MKQLLTLLIVLGLSGCALKPPAPDNGFAAVAAVAVGTPAATPADYQRALQAYRTDPQYPCRQPLYAAYFHAQGSAAADPAPCPAAVPLMLQSPGQGASVVWLDPARVQAVHLLFAGNSPSPASRFGHVALRLVVCPAANSSAADCDSNLDEHLVLSFQAHVDDYTLDLLKALGGDYQAHLFASRFMDSYEQYAIGEFRELYSLPLRMDAAQRETFVRDLVQVHWSFAGSYDFFTRNCVTLLQQALRVAWPDYGRDVRLREAFLRPDHFFAALRESPLAEGSALTSLADAERDGFYFASTLPFYQQALTTVRERQPGLRFDSLQGYMEIAPLHRRAALQAVPYANHLLEEPRTLEAQLMLEEYALFRSERLLHGQAADYLQRQDFSRRAGVLDETRGRVFSECFLAPLRQRTAPARRMAGIPANDDRFTDVPATADHCASPQSRQHLREAFARIGDDGSPQWQQLMRLVRYRADTLDTITQLRTLRR